MDRAGIETMLMNYYRNIDRNRIQFDFLCNKSKPGAYDEEILNLGGRIFHTPGLNPLKYGSYLKYMKSLFSEYPEYKIIEAHNGALGVYALNSAKINNIPVRIFHAHGASITKDLKYPLKLFCKWMIPNCANKYFSCGIEAARCYFGNKVVCDNRFTFIPNAIDVKKFEFSQEIRLKIRKEYKIENKKVIGHVGRFMKQKNHKFLLNIFSEVLKENSNVVLVMLGDGELLGAMKEYARTLNILNNVIFVGNVGNANEWYSAFDLFILPSIWEGLPVVGVEAQAAGLPCIFSDSITREIAITDKAQFIPLKANRNVWVEAISDKLANSSRDETEQQVTDNHYNICFEAKKLEELYLTLYNEN